MAAALEGQNVLPLKVLRSGGIRHKPERSHIEKAPQARIGSGRAVRLDVKRVPKVIEAQFVDRKRAEGARMAGSEAPVQEIVTGCKQRAEASVGGVGAAR